MSCPITSENHSVSISLIFHSSKDKTRETIMFLISFLILLGILERQSQATSNPSLFVIDWTQAGPVGVRAEEEGT